jgi:hypothetical protein
VHKLKLIGAVAAVLVGSPAVAQEITVWDVNVDEPSHASYYDHAKAAFEAAHPGASLAFLSQPDAEYYTLLGTALGLFGAWGLARMLHRLTPSLSANGSLTIALVAVLLVVVALLACWLPARRAAGRQAPPHGRLHGGCACGDVCRSRARGPASRS